jgi:hypothetical protein
VAEIKGRYYNLPHLDVTDQPSISNGSVNVLKKAVRLAVNENRIDDVGMKELINLLEVTLVHIDHANVRRVPKQRTAPQKAPQKRKTSLTRQGLG